MALTIPGTGGLALPAGSTAVTNAIGDNTASVATTAFVANSLGSLNTTNRIINGDMRIDQRMIGQSLLVTADNTPVLDCWEAFTSRSSVFSVQQNLDSVVPPPGFLNYLGIKVGASANVTVGAAEYFGVQQKIEGYNTGDLAWGTAEAAPITLSFWVRSSVVGTFGGAIANGTNYTRSYPFSYTISAANTWEKKSIVIPGDQASSWNATNTASLVLRLSIGTGSTLSKAASSWTDSNCHSAVGATSLISTNSATFYVTGVQIKKGIVDTGFEYRLYSTELMMCQRYYEAGTLQAVADGVMAYVGSSTSFSVPKRTTPTFMVTDNLGNPNCCTVDSATNVPAVITGDSRWVGCKVNNSVRGTNAFVTFYWRAAAPL